jgi:hypothetical protein
MTDINPDVTSPPIEVDPRLWIKQPATGMRDIGLIVAFVTALLGFAGQHNLNGAIGYLHSTQAIPAVSLLGGLAIFAWRQWSARRQQAVKVTLAEAAPDNVAVVKTSPTPTA